MKSLALLLALSICLDLSAATFTEFYVQPTGNNLNAGSTTNDAAVRTYTGGTFVQGTGVFTTASENPAADLVTTNDWASIYTTGATNATFIARVIGTNDTTITVSLTATSGVPTSVSESAGAATCKIGGAWAGPNTNQFQSAYGFPMSFIQNTLTNTSGNPTRCNVLSGIYPTTNTIAYSQVLPLTFSGYTNAPGDGAYFILSNANPSASIIVWNATSGAYVNSMIVDANCAAGNNYGAATSGGLYYRCIFKNAARSGVNFASTMIECEAYNNCRGNAAIQMGGFAGSSGLLLRCFSHDNLGGANADGFNLTSGGIYLIGCISATNGGNGFVWSGSSGGLHMLNCDAYANSSNGVSTEITGAVLFDLQNCNFADNRGYGIASFSGTSRIGSILNCGFSSGTTANTMGDMITSITNGMQSAVLLQGCLSYPANSLPWSGASYKDFRITLTQAKSAGVGTMLTNAVPSVVAYPDVGAGQNTSTNSSATTVSGGSYPFAQ